MEEKKKWLEKFKGKLEKKKHGWKEKVNIYIYILLRLKDHNPIFRKR